MFRKDHPPLRFDHFLAGQLRLSTTQPQFTIPRDRQKWGGSRAGPVTWLTMVGTSLISLLPKCNRPLERREMESNF